MRAEQVSSQTRGIWECWRCGTCCRLFAVNGPRVSPSEWLVLRGRAMQLSPELSGKLDAAASQEVPTSGSASSRSCIFLREGNVCLVYSDRPSACREYPIIISDGQEVVFRVSIDCPRGERIAELLEESLPGWAQAIVNGRKYRVIRASFFEEAMARTLGEEL